ncbi:MAG: hypothetical protein CL677_10805 [Bdellovibrionaceae bacterium]|mgnify:CR=1 FL=1|nr:hypothetical protein [Pseudobdellovibrionaceae bacterium]
MKVIVFALLILSSLISEARVHKFNTNSLNFPGFTVLSDFEIPEAEDAPYSEYEKLDSSTNRQDTSTSFIFKFHPTGNHTKYQTPQCDKNALKSLLKSEHGSPQSLSLRFSQWYDRCGDQLHDYGTFGALLKSQRINYEANNNPHIIPVQFTLRSGIQLRGLLGIKDLETPRPLVISKCGIYCNAESTSSVDNTLMHLFDESPFNVLVLANITGSDYSLDNKVVAMGGFEGGEQMLQAAEIIMRDYSTIRQIVSKVHFHGISLGGNAALMAAVYASHTNIPVGSAIATCPVVDLDSTLTSIFEPDARGFFYRLVTLSNLRKIFFQVPILGEYLNADELYKWDSRELREAFRSTAFENYHQWTTEEPWVRPPFEGTVIDTKEELWHLNNFIEHSQRVSIPTYVIHSSDDFLVRSELNAFALEKKLSERPNPNIGIIPLRRGNHCGFSMGIGWDVYSSLLRELVLKHTEDTEDIDRPTFVDLPADLKWKNSIHRVENPDELDPERYTIVDTQFAVENNKDHVLLTLKVFDKRAYRKVAGGKVRLRCHNKDPFDGQNYCYKEMTTQIPMSVFNPLQLQQVSSKFEARRMTRWLNVNARTLTENFESIIGKSTSPITVKFDRPYDFR